MPMYDGLSEVDDFLKKIEREVPEQQCFDALKWVLCAMPARWWGTYQTSFEDRCECRRMMCMWFVNPQMWMKAEYEERNSLCAHLSIWVRAYGAQPTQRHNIRMIGNTIGK